MAQLRVSMFGPLEVEWGTAGPPLESLKAQELLVYLLLHPNRIHQRETVASVLWCEQGPSRARQYLRKALWQLQSRLQQCPDTAGVLSASADGVGLNGNAAVWFDVRAFETGCAQAHGVPGQRMNVEQADAMRRAVTLYRGELLVGWYPEWCLLERERLHIVYLGALDKLIGYCEAHGEFEEGIEYAQAILRDDRAREHTHRALMRLLFLSGDRTGGLRQFDRCVAALKDELQIDPAPVTVRLAEEIRSGQPPGDGSADRIESSTAAALLQRLQRLQDTLQAVQRQLAREVEAIDSALRHYAEQSPTVTPQQTVMRPDLVRPHPAAPGMRQRMGIRHGNADGSGDF